MARASRSSASVVRSGKRIRTSPRVLAQDRPQLGPEQPRVAQRQAQAAQPQARVGFDIGRCPVRSQLVGPQIERPDHDRPPPQRADHGGVRLELLIFAGGGLGVQEQKLGAEQPDALGAQVHAGVDLRGELDIAPEMYLGGIERFGRQIGLLREDPESCGPLGGRRAIPRLGGQIRVEDDQTLVAVDDRHPALSGDVQELAQADHGRDFKRRGDDGRVAGTASRLGGEAEHAIGIKPRSLARRQVLCQDQGGGRQLILERLGSLSDQLAEDPGLDVTHVGGAGRQVGIAQPLQAGRVRLEHLDDGMLGGDLLMLDPGAGVRAEGDIADHAGVGRQDVGVLGAQPGSSFPLGLRGFSAGNLQPVIEPLQFAPRPPLP